MVTWSFKKVQRQFSAEKVTLAIHSAGVTESPCEKKKKKPLLISCQRKKEKKTNSQKAIDLKINSKFINLFE